MYLGTDPWFWCKSGSTDHRRRAITTCRLGISSKPKKMSDANIRSVWPGSTTWQRCDPYWNWALTEILNSALKKGKGQQDILAGAVYRGSCEHVVMKAGGNEACQLLVASTGAVTSPEKYLITHAAHTTIQFVAAAWNTLGAYPDDSSKKRSPSETSNTDAYDDRIPDWNDH